MNDEETTSRILVVQLDAGNAVRRNDRYVRLTARLEELRVAFLKGNRTSSQFFRGCAYNMARLPVPLLEQGAQGGVAIMQDGDDVQAIIPWVELDTLLGVDAPLWQPWN